MDRRQAIRKTGLAAGSALLVPSLITLLHSCKSEPRLSWQPLFLAEKEAQFLSVLVDTILPRTDTPGGLDVKADMFMDKIFAKVYDASAQQQIKSDIAQFNADCQEKFGNSFIELSKENQTAVLKAAEASSGKFNGGVWGTAVGEQEPVGFYRSIKSMAIWAYLSSEEIGKNVLNYDPVPQMYKGCIPLAEVGNKWSL